MDIKPDWLVIMIGINDIWRHFDAPFRADVKVDEDEFVSIYRELIEKIKDSVHEMILMSPFYVNFYMDNPMTKMVRSYAKR